MMGTSFPTVFERTRDGDPSAFASLWHEYQPVAPPLPARDHPRRGRGCRVGDVGRGGHLDHTLRRRRDCVPRVALHRRPPPRVDHFRRESRRPSVPIDPAVALHRVDRRAGRRPRRRRGGAGSTPRPRCSASPNFPPANATAVMLRAIAGLDVAHAAAIMGKRPGTVRVLAHRGLRELARRLAEEGRTVTPLTARCALFCDVPQPGPTPDTASRRSHRRAAAQRRAASRTSRMPTARSRDCSRRPPARRARASSKARRRRPPRSSPRITSPTSRAAGDGRWRHRSLVAVTLAASTGTAIAATQGALPSRCNRSRHEALGTVGISVPGIERSDDSGTHPSGATMTTPTTGATLSGATPTTTPRGRPQLAGPGDRQRRRPPARHRHRALRRRGHRVRRTRTQGEGNNNAGGVGQRQRELATGKPVGTPTDGDGTDTPVNNLPSQSNGKGNGPPQVPPGQAKK